MNELIARAKAEKRVLLEPEAMQLLAEYELPVPTHSLVTSKEQAVVAAEKTGYPVVLKIVSKDILHKSDVGGVKIGLNSKEAVEKAYEEIMENVREKAKGAVIGGMLVVAHAPQGIECIVGMTKDPQFGPAFLFGLGGIFVELLNDVSFRVLPLTKEDAEEHHRQYKFF